MAIWIPYLRRSMPSRGRDRFYADTSKLEVCERRNISSPEQNAEICQTCAHCISTRETGNVICHTPAGRMKVCCNGSTFINLDPRNLVLRYDRNSVTQSWMYKKRTSCSDIHSHNAEPKFSTSIIFYPSPWVKNDSISQDDCQVWTIRANSRNRSPFLSP